ncbi:MAG TPA: HU family DNA-binding protein [Gammaproteobacteria bacterium]|jgi:nucleoid DNA-binding protein|nr:HU family DNA-binding protein [Gammaproteobacteria bacterium]
MAKKSKMKRKSNGRSASKSTRTKKAASRTMPKAAKKTTMSQVKLPSSYREPLSKSAMIKAITEATCIGKKDVVAVLDCLTEVIEKHVKPGCAGKFVMPGLMKITVVKKPARSARKGINPFTGEEIMIKARPAYKAVKIKPLKQLKEMVT